MLTETEVKFARYKVYKDSSRQMKKIQNYNNFSEIVHSL